MNFTTKETYLLEDQKNMKRFVSKSTQAMPAWQQTRN